MTDFLSCDTIEEEVVAGAHEGKQIVINSGTKPKVETITLSQWFIANLAIQYRLLCDGNLPQVGMIDYMSYTAHILHLTPRYENVSVYFYDREYRKLQAALNFRWGTDIPHLQTMQLTPRAPRNNARRAQNAPGPSCKPTHYSGPVTADGKRGCLYPDCKFTHTCSYRGCNQAYSAFTHHQSR